MTQTTCGACMDQWHRKCEDKVLCACSVCGTRATKRPSVKPVVVVREGYIATTARSARQKPTSAARTYAKKTGPIPGAHGLKGRSTLDTATQQVVAHRLGLGWTISETARAAGCSRDQVRTIKQRQEALEGATPR